MVYIFIPNYKRGNGIQWNIANLTQNIQEVTDEANFES